MSNHSPDSLTKQLSQIQQQATIAEQTLFSKNAEIQAVQKKLNSLKDKFARETDRLLKEQAATLHDQQDGLKAQNEAVKEELTRAQRATKHQQEMLDVAAGELHLVKTEVATTSDALHVLQKQVKLAEARLVEVRAVVGLSLDEHSSLTVKIAELTNQEQALKEIISDLDTDIASRQQDIAQQEAVFKATEAERQSKLAAIEAKIAQQTQIFEEATREQQVLRHELAAWESRLQARDENLRIREAKVTDGESKLVMNSELLNL